MEQIIIDMLPIDVLAIVIGKYAWRNTYNISLTCKRLNAITKKPQYWTQAIIECITKRITKPEMSLTIYEIANTLNPYYFLNVVLKDDESEVSNNHTDFLKWLFDEHNEYIIYYNALNNILNGITIPTNPNTLFATYCVFVTWLQCQHEIKYYTYGIMCGGEFIVDEIYYQYCIGHEQFAKIKMKRKDNAYFEEFGFHNEIIYTKNKDNTTSHLIWTFCCEKQHCKILKCEKINNFKCSY